jgi:hypothetical protein
MRVVNIIIGRRLCTLIFSRRTVHAVQPAAARNVRQQEEEVLALLLAEAARRLAIAARMNEYVSSLSPARHQIILLS